MPQLCTTPNCPCSQSPFANLSSELPDKEVFIGLFWAFEQPQLGTQGWTRVICGASCQSSISQQEADLCAKRAAERCCLCDHQPEPPCVDPCGGDCANSIQPSCVDPPIAPCPPPFGNVQQGCQSDQFSSQVAACEFYAHTQADADAIANSVCQYRLLNGPRTPNVANCPVILGIFPPSPIHLSQGETLVLSVAYTYTGPGPLTFLWSLNNIPLANTPASTLTIPNVTDVDSGSYTLQIVAPGCPVIFSPSVTVEVVSTGCGTDTDINAAPTNEDLVTIEERGDFTAPASSNCDGIPDRVYTSIGNLPDGYYVWQYLGGVWQAVFTHLADVPPCAGNPSFTNYGVVFCGATYTDNGTPVDAFEFFFGDCPIDPNPAVPQQCIWDNYDDGIDQPVVASSLFHHTGGEMQVFGPKLALYDFYCPCGTVVCSPSADPVTFRLLEYVLDDLPERVRIKDYAAQFLSPLQACAGCDNRVGVEWDGTFPFRFYQPLFNDPPTTDLRYEPVVNSANSSIGGKVFSSSQASIFLSTTAGNVPCWFIVIQCKVPGGGSSQILWQGEKVTGLTPAGIYNLIPGACFGDQAPTCLIIEEY